jgi:hypothetical protein
LTSNTNFEETKSDLVAMYYPWILQMTEARKLIESSVNKFLIIIFYFIFNRKSQKIKLTI